MANRTYTLTLTDFDLNTAASVAGSNAGSAGAGVVIVDIAESADRSDVVQALKDLASLIAANQVILN
tara:strand:- start:917 stop:1117 length:201 start_codon:yes stop_codon:yes gene_type:complete